MNINITRDVLRCLKRQTYFWKGQSYLWWYREGWADWLDSQPTSNLDLVKRFTILLRHLSYFFLLVRVRFRFQMRLRTIIQLFPIKSIIDYYSFEEITHDYSAISNQNSKWWLLIFFCFKAFSGVSPSSSSSSSFFLFSFVFSAFN